MNIKLVSESRIGTHGTEYETEVTRLQHNLKPKKLAASFYIKGYNPNSKAEKKPKFDLNKFNDKYIELSKTLEIINVNFRFCTNYEFVVNARTTLISPVIDKNLEALKILSENIKVVNNNKSYIPLILAFQKEKSELVKLLLEMKYVLKLLMVMVCKESYHYY